MNAGRLFATQESRLDDFTREKLLSGGFDLRCGLRLRGHLAHHRRILNRSVERLCLGCRYGVLQFDFLRVPQRDLRLLEAQLDPSTQLAGHVVFAVERGADL
jgi:hypothetical protein